MRLPLSNLLPLLLALTLPYTLYRTLSLLASSSSPIVVVISESMAPAFHRGDILFLWNRAPVVRVGDIPVVWFQGRDLPMVHRAVHVHWERQRGGKHELVQHILTKGDNNAFDDVALYPPGRQTASRDEVVGLVRGYIPCLGWAAIGPRELLQSFKGFISSKLRRMSGA